MPQEAAVPTPSSRGRPRVRSSSTARTGTACPGAGQGSSSGRRTCGFRRRLEAYLGAGETDRRRRRYEDSGRLNPLSGHRADGQNVAVLYDLTSTYFESDPPEEESIRKFGYSRDKRSDCVQVVIALIVTPEGLPLAYEVMAGNTSDKTTLWEFVEKIEAQYGKAMRTWVMDRGIPTEETLEKMRTASPRIDYLVGTPRGRLTKLEKQFLVQPWQQAREQVKVKLLDRDGELYILARSEGRVDKERAMRQRTLKKLIKRLHELRGQKLDRDALLLKLGAAKRDAGRSYHLMDIRVPGKDEAVNEQSFTFSIKRDKLRKARRHEGHYLLRSNVTGESPEKLWQFYIQLTEVEQAFKELKSDLAIRPIHHLDTGEFLQHRTRGQSRCQCAQPLLEGCLQAVGDKGNEDVRLDAFVLLMVDGSDRQVAFEFLERLLHLGELDVELPQLLG